VPPYIVFHTKNKRPQHYTTAFIAKNQKADHLLQVKKATKPGTAAAKY
jgi:hypothetical protein